MALQIIYEDTYGNTYNNAYARISKRVHHLQESWLSNS